MGLNTEREYKAEEELLLQILGALRGIRYGYVQIVVQDSKVVQIEKTEKIRLDKEDYFIPRGVRAGRNG